jgi:hypothetical protein
MGFHRTRTRTQRSGTRTRWLFWFSRDFEILGRTIHGDRDTEHDRGNRAAASTSTSVAMGFHRTRTRTQRSGTRATRRDESLRRP